MKKKFLAVALAATMVVSSAVTAMAETLTSESWWSGAANSSDYALTGDGSLTLQIEVTAEASAGGAAFCVEAYENSGGPGNGYFFTTGSDGNGWFAEAALAGGNSADMMTKCPFAENGNAAAGSVEAGHTYEVTITRSGKDFTAVYNDVTAGTQLYEIAGTAGADFPETINIHVMPQLGTIEVTEKTGGATQVEPTSKKDDDATKADDDKNGSTDSNAGGNSDGGNSDGGTTAAGTTDNGTAAQTGDTATATAAAFALVLLAAAGAVVVLKKKNVTE